MAKESKGGIPPEIKKVIPYPEISRMSLETAMNIYPELLKAAGLAVGRKLTVGDLVAISEPSTPFVPVYLASPLGAVTLVLATDEESEGYGGRVAIAGISERNHGIYGRSSKGFAGFFEGNVHSTGTVNAKNCCAEGADCAENFEVASSETVDAGTVVIVGDDGRLVPCSEGYDQRAAGVISGAGEYKPGLLLDAAAPYGASRPLALVGKVYCKAEAHSAPIEAGDLLTTSTVLGHAMKASDNTRASGAIVGKALGSLGDGIGLIPILVSLQ